MRAEQPHDAFEHGDQIARLHERRRQAEHVGEAAHEAVQLLGPLDDDADGALEVGTARRVSSAA